MFLLNSRNPLVRFSSELMFRRAGLADESVHLLSCFRQRAGPQTLLSAAERAARQSGRGPEHHILRANPFPEVTDLFCRLPLSTFFYRPEAAHLGDLMRLSVRPAVISHALPRIFTDRHVRN